MRAPWHMDNYRTDGDGGGGGSLYISADDLSEDFSDYLWMEDVESFDKQVLAELEEEEEMELEMQEMLAEEEARDTTYYVVDEQSLAVIACPALALSRASMALVQAAAAAAASAPLCDAGILLLSELNPEAAEFVPARSSAAIDATPATTATSSGGATPGAGGDAPSSPDR